MKTTAKTKKRPDTRLMTVRQLADALGRSKSSVDRWTRHPQWIFGKGPWPRAILSRVKEWTRVALRETDESPAPQPVVDQVTDVHRLSPLQKMRLLKLKWEAERIRIEVEQTNGTLHNAVDCKTRRLAQITFVRDQLLGLKRSLGHKGVPDQYIEMIDQHVREALTAWSEDRDPRYT